MTNEITQADRELLAAEYEREGCPRSAEFVRTQTADGGLVSAVIALRAIAAARRQAQAPSGGEPVAWMRTDPRVIEDAEVGKEPPAMWLMKGWTHVPLYTAPPSAPKAQPVANGVVQRHVVTKFSDGSTRVEDVLTTPSAPVDEAMVERACKAAIEHFWPDDYDDMDDLRAMMQSALTAALAQQPASDGGFTAADMMVARQEGRKEAQQPAAQPGGSDNGR